jgi:hypothetical protein
MAEDFYQQVPEVSSFSEVVNPEIYSPLPDNWSIISTDIKGSTDAIRAGMYKQVNMAGASIIAAISNYFKPVRLPFIFGGDGSTVAIPTRNIDQINGILIYCKEAVQKAYGLELATGCLSMKKIRKAGHDILIAKYKLSDHVEQALFWGSGLEYVEELVKSEEFKIDSFERTEADFSGLECRWNQVPSKNDEIVSIIIKAFGDNDSEKRELYKRSIQKIEHIYGDDINCQPIQLEQLKLSGNPTELSSELKLRSHPSTLLSVIQYSIKLYIMQFLGWFFMKFSIKTSETNWADYKKEFVQHADYRKFSDALRLVISGDISQRLELQDYLEGLYSGKKIAYGIHSSFAAITTCYVTNYQHHHIHFVDGSDGGYAKASQDLKIRLSKLEAPSTE